jgi:hypothetical protein
MQPYSYLPGIPRLQFGKSAIHVILDAVRNTILEWSLKLELAGILGSEMSFSSDERTTASENAASLRPSVYISIGRMENSTIQQCSPGGSSNTSPNS